MVKQIFVLVFILSAISLSAPNAGEQACASEMHKRLLASRDALIAQEKEIQRAYDEVSRRINELKEKQALLDHYLRATDQSIRSVDRAIATTR